MGSSSSQPRSSQPRSPINRFPMEELYTPEFSESLQENIDDAPWQVAWTIKEEIALDKVWKSVSKNSERGNARKKNGFWVEVMEYIESKTKMEGRQTYDMESGAGDEDYVQKAMGSSKRHKSSGSSSFNTESEDASINLNNTVVGDDEVQEIRRPGAGTKQELLRKIKGPKRMSHPKMRSRPI
ncbi:hypothetical protein Tco_1446639 [Tanacetum coccineum]